MAYCYSKTPCPDTVCTCPGSRYHAPASSSVPALECCTPYNPCAGRTDGECVRDISSSSLPTSPDRKPEPDAYVAPFEDGKMEEFYQHIIKRENYLRSQENKDDALVEFIDEGIVILRSKHQSAIHSKQLLKHRLLDSQFIVPTCFNPADVEDGVHKEIKQVFDFFAGLPKWIKERLVIAGGAVTDFIISNNEPNDYDLFLLSPQPGMAVTSEDLIKNLLEGWQNRISRISRTQHAISLSLDISERPVETMTDRARLYRMRAIAESSGIDVYEKLKKISELFPKRHKGKYVKIQIILREYVSIGQILLGFDIDACRFAWCNGKVYGTQSGLFAVRNAINVVNLQFASETYNYRLVKYMRKGFAIYVPTSLCVISAGHYKARDSSRFAYRRNKEGSLIGLLCTAKAQQNVYRRYMSPDINYCSDYCTIDPKEGCKRSGKTIRFFRNDKKIIGYGFNPYFVPISNIFTMPSYHAMNPWANRLCEIVIELPEKLTLIAQDPDRQFTGSFHPMDIKPESWGAITFGDV